MIHTIISDIGITDNVAAVAKVTGFAAAGNQANDPSITDIDVTNPKALPR